MVSVKSFTRTGNLQENFLRTGSSLEISTPLKSIRLKGFDRSGGPSKEFRTWHRRAQSRFGSFLLPWPSVQVGPNITHASRPWHWEVP